MSKKKKSTKKIKTYKSKKADTRKRYQNLFDKVIKSGKTIDAIKRMSKETYNETFGTNITTERSLKAQHYILDQIKRDASYVVNDYIKEEKIQNPKIKEAYFNETGRIFKTKAKKVEDIDVIKYKKLEQEGQYGTIVVKDLKDGKEYYIKYDDEASLNKQINKLNSKYNITNYTTRFLSTRAYKTYITKEFNKNLKKHKIEMD